MFEIKTLLPDYTSMVNYFIVLMILVYFCFSAVLAKQAKDMNIRNFRLSWFPVVDLWILGKVIKTFKIGTKEFNNAEYRLITSSVVFILLANVPIVGVLIGTAYMILVISCMLEFANRLVARN